MDSSLDADKTEKSPTQYVTELLLQDGDYWVRKIIRSDMESAAQTVEKKSLEIIEMLQSGRISPTKELPDPALFAQFLIK